MSSDGGRPSNQKAPDTDQTAEPEVPLPGGSHSGVVRVGQTVRRLSRPWAPSIHDLLVHLERAGFRGAPRALGFDNRGREILSYIEGEVGGGDALIPDEGGRFDRRRPAFVWHDEALTHLGGLLRAFHDAAATFPWTGRDWCYEVREPIETLCHNEAFPQNTVFRCGVPVAFIDWDTAAPGPRSWDLGGIAWFWVPFWRDEKCRAHGLPIGVTDKARRFRLLLDAYGVQPDVAIVHAGIARMRDFLGDMQQSAAEGSEHELEAERRGAFDELALEIAWVEKHVGELVRS